MGIFTNFLSQKRQPVQTQPVQTQPQQTEMPQVDRSNPIGSLAQMLGPTPAEREAQQKQLEQQRQKMTAWTALADGLRSLGNLYYTAKGARPQQFADPYKQINENYQRDKQNIDDAATYRQKYAQQLYTLQRQANEDSRKDILAKAQAKWYDTKDEMAHQKTELDKLKAVKVIKMEGRLYKYDPSTGETEALTETDPLYQQYRESQIGRNNRAGTGSGRGSSLKGYNEHYVRNSIDENGNPVKEYYAGRYNPGEKKEPVKKTVAKPHSTKTGQSGTKPAKTGQNGTKPAKTGQSNKQNSENKPKTNSKGKIATGVNWRKKQ